MSYICIINIDIVQLLSRVWLSVNPWTPVSPVLHYLPEFSQTRAHRVSDAIQTFHPLSSPSPALSLSQHQGLFQWVDSSRQMAKVLEFQLQHQSFNGFSGLISFRLTGLIPLLFKGLSRVFPAPQFKSISSLALSLLYGPTVSSTHDHWKTIALTRWIFVGK